MVHGKSHIDPEKCIKCGKCKSVCPYDAISHQVRPCAAACGVNAIKNDAYGRACIDSDMCVSCGQCMVSCPFGAIADKSQIFQLIRAIQSGAMIIAQVAPAFVGQFGPDVTPNKLKKALKMLGFADVYETAIGADMGAMAEAHHYVEKVATKELPFLLTSCCPSWSMLAKKAFPDIAPYISMALTPMVLTARLQKQKDPGCRVVFVGPCSAKKLEASSETIRSDVDFVLTFEELMGMFEAKQVDFSKLPSCTPLHEGTGAGRGFAVSGGVAQAVVDAIHRIDPTREVKTVYAEGLQECRKMVALARAGKYNGYLLEGMGCPGGCVAGMGTLQPPQTTAAAIAKYKKEAESQNAFDSKCEITLPSLEE